MQAGGRGQWLGGSLIVVVSALVALAFDGLGPEFPLDDAYIHLSYAKSLRLGEGLSYNPHDWELGATSPLWVVLLALVPQDAHVVLWVKLLGALLHGLSVAASVLLALELAGLPGASPGALTPRARWLIAGTTAAFSALHPLLLQGATSGMEVPLTVALLAVTTLALVRGAYTTAAVLAALSVWARPESLAYVGCVCALLCLGPERRRAWLPIAAAVAAMAAWSVYCLASKGQPLPNTYYAKTYETRPLIGLSYLVLKVLSREPWLLGATGAVAIVLQMLRGRGMPRRWTLLLFASWLGTSLAIALSRYLNPGILFYMQRYFAIVAFVPPVLLAVALSERKRPALWLAPCLIVLAAMSPGTQKAIQAQQHSIRREVAHWVAAKLPADSTLLVEYAGALRYFTKRTTHVVDLLGLNTSGVAMTLRSKLYLCALASYQPGYLVVPGELTTRMAGIFQGDVLKVFTDPAFAQSDQPFERKVLVIRVTGLHEDAVARCREQLRGQP